MKHQELTLGYAVDFSDPSTKNFLERAFVRNHKLFLRSMFGDLRKNPQRGMLKKFRDRLFKEEK